MSWNPARWWRRLRRGQRASAEAAVRAATANRVVAGPFSGLQYPPSIGAGGSALAPKLLGTYELEIHRWVEEIIAQRPARVINIGAGEGYYAVGMAMRNSATTVIAFEMDPHSRASIEALAHQNAVPDQLEIRGAASAAELAELVGNGDVLLCDCEGCELELLDRERVPTLNHCTILVETHVADGVDTAELLRPHFAPSHVIREVLYQPALRRSIPVHTVPAGLWKRSVNERRRYGLRWLFLTPRT